MFIVVLPPGVNPIAVNKYINININNPNNDVYFLLKYAIS